MFSTAQAAKKLGIDPKTLSRYIAAGKVPAPKVFNVGTASLHGWTEGDIEQLRQILPKIANGRKTRWQKLKAKNKEAQPRAAVPHEQRKKQMKKKSKP